MRYQIIMAALSIPLSLAGCGGPSASGAMPDELLTVSHPIKVQQDMRTITLPMARNGHSDVDEHRLGAIAIDIVRRGHGVVEVSGPKEAASEVAVGLINKGVSKFGVLVKPMSGSDVVVSFTVFKASAAPCGEFASDANAFGSARSANNVSSEWGCSTQRNLSLMISDPLDLVRMSGTEKSANGNAAGQRVIDVFQTYVPPAAPTVSGTK